MWPLVCAQALGVWLVGVGVKIALYNPVAPTHAFFSHDQRLQLGAACAVAYGVNGAMTPLHTSFAEFYGGAPSAATPWYARYTPYFKLLWAANIATMLGATWIWVEPYEYLLIQTGLGVLHMTCLHVELVWLPAYLRGSGRVKAAAQMH